VAALVIVFVVKVIIVKGGEVGRTTSAPLPGRPGIFLFLNNIAVALAGVPVFGTSGAKWTFASTSRFSPSTC